MALKFLRSLFISEPRRFNIYRAYCKAVNAEQRLHDNPYFEKYADKIADVQKLSPEEFKQMCEEKFKSAKSINDISAIPQPKHAGEDQAKRSMFRSHKDLGKIMKLEALQDKSPAEIESIWKQYHQSRDGVYAVLPSDAYKKMFLKLQEFPVFLFPIPRAQGYEFIMHQFMDHSCYFTSLINYQAYKENAPICVTVNYYTDFMDDKGIVLMRGEYDEKSLNVQEVQYLTNQLQLYYGSSDEKMERMLWTFNKQPEMFRHMDLISNLEYSITK